MSAERLAYQWHQLRLLAWLLAVRCGKDHEQEALWYVQVHDGVSTGPCFASCAKQALGGRARLLKAVAVAVLAPSSDLETAGQTDVLGSFPGRRRRLVAAGGKSGSLGALEMVYGTTPLSFWMKAEVSSPAQRYAQRQCLKVAAAAFEAGCTEEEAASRLEENSWVSVGAANVKAKDE